MAKLVGNAVIGQSGGPTCVINQSLVGVIEAAKKSKEIKKLLGARHAIKGMLKEDFIDLFKEPAGVLLGELFEHHAEKELWQPTFITDYPVELSPLTKELEGDPRFVDRF